VPARDDKFQARDFPAAENLAMGIEGCEWLAPVEIGEVSRISQTAMSTRQTVVVINATVGFAVLWADRVELTLQV
jgi:hypothetical protein